MVKTMADLKDELRKCTVLHGQQTILNEAKKFLLGMAESHAPREAPNAA